MKKFKLTKKEFEANEVYTKKDLKKGKLRPTGYEAYRVSPRKSKKFGSEYRKIYGAVISPDYSRKNKKGEYGSKVEWFPHGYTKANVRPGTRLQTNIKNYPVDKKETAFKLMLKPKRKRKKK